MQQHTQHEEWRPVVGHEGHYEVSNLGRVKSLARKLPMRGSGGRSYPERILSPSNAGHPHVVLSAPDGKRQTWMIHRLVITAFLGPCPEGMEIRHLNDVRTDNRLENLAYGSSSDNMFDRVRNGIHHNAIKTHCKNGHEFTSENTFINHGGSRECRICRRNYMREYPGSGV